ncbi:hypothetical protein [Timonella sp. A28]|uniref:hypothetical protein n=1 Tax=Timonella sp. A28 TaxID=3442640 RepID=UPI003EBEC091
MSSRITIKPSRGVSLAGLVAVTVGLILVIVGGITWGLISQQLASERITVSEDAAFFANKKVNDPLSAYAQADVIRKHSLDATGGRTYAEIPREDPVRDTAMNASFLRASLFTSVVSFGLAAFAIAVGIVFILVGWAVRRLAGGPPVIVETQSTGPIIVETPYSTTAREDEEPYEPVMAVEPVPAPPAPQTPPVRREPVPTGPIPVLAVNGTDAAASAQRAVDAMSEGSKTSQIPGSPASRARAAAVDSSAVSAASAASPVDEGAVASDKSSAANTEAATQEQTPEPALQISRSERLISESRARSESDAHKNGMTGTIPIVGAAPEQDKTPTAQDSQDTNQTSGSKKKRRGKPQTSQATPVSPSDAAEPEPTTGAIGWQSPQDRLK